MFETVDQMSRYINHIWIIWIVYPVKFHNLLKEIHSMELYDLCKSTNSGSCSNSSRSTGIIFH